MSIEAMKQALEALEVATTPLAKDRQEVLRAQAALRQAIEQAEYRCCPHDSDCAVHNMPAYPAGPCNCSYSNTFNLPPSSTVHEVCLKLATRELEKITDENFWRTSNDGWTNKIVDVYSFFESNPKAKKLTEIYTAPPQRTWVGLTPEELNMIGDSMRTWNSWSITDVYIAIEAKLKEKNT